MAYEFLNSCQYKCNKEVKINDHVIDININDVQTDIKLDLHGINHLSPDSVLL